jgi:hypothetical protein
MEKRQRNYVAQYFWIGENSRVHFIIGTPMDLPKTETKFQCKVCRKIISAKLPHIRKDGKEYCTNASDFTEI